MSLFYTKSHLLNQIAKTSESCQCRIAHYLNQSIQITIELNRDFIVPFTGRVAFYPQGILSGGVLSEILISGHSISG